MVHLLLSIAPEMIRNYEFVVGPYIAKSLFHNSDDKCQFSFIHVTVFKKEGGVRHEEIIIESYNALSRGRKEE